MFLKKKKDKRKQMKKKIAKPDVLTGSPLMESSDRHYSSSSWSIRHANQRIPSRRFSIDDGPDGGGCTCTCNPRVASHAIITCKNNMYTTLGDSFHQYLIVVWIWTILRQTGVVLLCQVVRDGHRSPSLVRHGLRLPYTVVVDRRSSPGTMGNGYIIDCQH